MNLKKIAALAIQFGLAYSYCDTVADIYAMEVCQDVGDSTWPNSAIFSCSATGGLLVTVYEGNGCDGEVWFDGAADELFNDDDLSYNCGGETCEVAASITNYFTNNGTCTAIGASNTLQVPGGCIGNWGGNLQDGYYAFTQCDGSTGGSGANVLLYDGPDCTGNLVAVMAGETGCADDGTYEVFSCTGAGEVRAFDPALVVDSFDDYEARRARQMTTRRPRRGTTRRPRSTVAAVAANVFGARAFPSLDLDKIVAHVQVEKEAEVVADTATCNIVGDLFAVDACITISHGEDDDPTVAQSAMASCSPTGTALIDVYSSNDCSGVPTESREDPDIPITCDGIPCNAFTVTNYETCTATDVFEAMPIPLGCLGALPDLRDDVTGYTQCNGADGAFLILYDGPECTGNQVAVARGDSGCDDSGRLLQVSCSGDAPRDFDPALEVDNFNEFEEEEEQRMMRRRRRRTTRRPGPPPSTVSAAENFFFSNKFGGLNTVLVRAGAHKEEMVAQQGDWAQHGTKANVVMMIGVFALVAVMAVYFCAGRLVKKGKGLSEDSALLPAYGAVNA